MSQDAGESGVMMGERIETGCWEGMKGVKRVPVGEGGRCGKGVGADGAGVVKELQGDDGLACLSWI